MSSVTRTEKQAQELCDKSYIDLAKQSEEVKNFDAQIADAEKAFKGKESTLTALANIDSTDQGVVALKDAYIAETLELKNTISDLKSDRDTSYNLFATNSQIYTSVASYCSADKKNDPQQLLTSVSSTTPTSTPTPRGATTPASTPPAPTSGQPAPVPAPTPLTPPVSSGDSKLATAQTQVEELFKQFDELTSEYTRFMALESQSDAEKIEMNAIKEGMSAIPNRFKDDNADGLYLRHALFVQMVEDVLGSSKELEDYKNAMTAQTNITVKCNIDHEGQYNIQVTLSHPDESSNNIDKQLEKLITQSFEKALNAQVFNEISFLELLINENSQQNNSYSIVNFPIIQ